MYIMLYVNLPFLYDANASLYFCKPASAALFLEYPFGHVELISIVLLASFSASKYLPAFA